MAKYFQKPTEQFYMLPNNIFDLRLHPIQFAIYSYLVSCAGSKLTCYPRQETIADKTGIGISSAQKHLKILEQRKLIEVSKHIKPYGYPNNQYTLLSLDNPEIYRDLTSVEVDELPMFIGGDLPA